MLLDLHYYAPDALVSPTSCRESPPTIHEKWHEVKVTQNNEISPAGT